MSRDGESALISHGLAEQKGLTKFTKLEERNAWDLGVENEYDLISSNGLNIYEADDEKVTALYREFYQALKPKGTLVASYLTPPPTQTENCEWAMSKIMQEDLLLL